MTRYFGVWDPVDEEFTIIISANDREEFAAWLIEFCQLPKGSLEDIERHFAMEGQYIRECDVLPY